MVHGLAGQKEDAANLRCLVLPSSSLLVANIECCGPSGIAVEVTRWDGRKIDDCRKGTCQAGGGVQELRVLNILVPSGARSTEHGARSTGEGTELKLWNDLGSA